MIFDEFTESPASFQSYEIAYEEATVEDKDEEDDSS